MASRTIARLFDRYAEAAAAVRDLEAAGFSHDDVSLVSSGATADDAAPEDADEGGAAGAGTGATVGTLVGGGAGLLAGIGALAIPGVGPIVAAGWLVATLTGAGVGAAAGGLLGGLTTAGIGEEHAEIYAEGVRRGGNLVTVRTDDTRAVEAEAILARHNAVDTDQRAADYRSGGWTGYDAGATMAAWPEPDHGFGSAPQQPTGASERPAAAPQPGGSLGMTSSGPDATPPNPPGTVASRALDALTGTTVSGTSQQAAPRTDAGSLGLTPSGPDGSPGNPPGTMASRAVDRLAGTNLSGAYPEHADGIPRNRPGTAAERAHSSFGTAPPQRDPAT
jgi:hypothetical protein